MLYHPLYFWNDIFIYSDGYYHSILPPIQLGTLNKPSTDSLQPLQTSWQQQSCAFWLHALSLFFIKIRWWVHTFLYLKKRINHSHIPSLIPSLDFVLQNIASTQDQSLTPVWMWTMWHTRTPPRMKWCWSRQIGLQFTCNWHRASSPGLRQKWWTLILSWYDFFHVIKVELLLENITYSHYRTIHTPGTLDGYSKRWQKFQSLVGSESCYICPTSWWGRACQVPTKIFPSTM